MKEILAWIIIFAIILWVSTLRKKCVFKAPEVKGLPPTGRDRPMSRGQEATIRNMRESQRILEEKEDG